MEKIIGYFCPKDGFYKDEPFVCSVCGAEAKAHKATDRSSKTPDRYDNIYIYVDKMKEVTQRNAIQMLKQGY